MAYRDDRDPETLGKLIHAHADRRRKGGQVALHEVADEVDRGAMGKAFCHPAFLNGKTHMRLPVAFYER